MNPLRGINGLCVATVLILPGIAYSWEVPGDSPTIQAAIDTSAVASGDTITLMKDLTDNHYIYTGFVSTSKSLNIVPAVGKAPVIEGSGELPGGTLKGVTFRALSNSIVFFANVGLNRTMTIEDCRVVGTGAGGSVGVYYQHYGTVVIKNCVIDSVSYALSTQGGAYSTVTVEDCQFFTGSGGIENSGGELTMSRSTLVNAYNSGHGRAVRYGVVYGFTQCIVAGFDTLFAGSWCGTGTVAHNVMNGYSTLSTGSCTVSGSDNFLATDPLFCEAREGEVKKYSLRIDSPAIAANNSWAVDIGKTDGVECAWGTLARNATVPANASVTVLEDVTVPSGRILTLNSGAGFRFDDDDESPGGGNDGLLNELIVGGILVVNGTSGAPVSFDTKNTSPAEGDWYGVDARTASKLQVAHASVKHAQYGLLTRNGSADSNTVANSTFSDNEIYDILCGSGEASSSLSLRGNYITVGGGTGIYFTGQFSGATVSNDTLSGNASSTNGISFGNLAGTSTPAFRFNRIVNIHGAGIKLDGGNATLTNNVIAGCTYGIHVTGGTHSIGTSSSSSDNDISVNTQGIKVEAASCSFGPVTIRNNQIHDNTSGVNAYYTANVDLGTGSGNRGNNSFYYNGSCINEISDCGTVSAQYNWFGQCGDPPCSFGGSVDHSNAYPCGSPPASVLVDVEFVPEAALVIKGFSPNPTATGGVLQFSLGKATHVVEVGIFDVSGRLVRMWNPGTLEPGSHEVVWDGRDRAGRNVPEGLYFVRVNADDNVRAASKILVVH